MNRHMRTALLILSVACLAASGSGLVLWLHLPGHVGDQRHEGRGHAQHDSERCPICQVMLVRFAKYVVEPQIAVVRIDAVETSAPEDGDTFTQHYIPSVLAPRPPPPTEA